MQKFDGHCLVYRRATGETLVEQITHVREIGSGYGAAYDDGNKRVVFDPYDVIAILDRTATCVSTPVMVGLAPVEVVDVAMRKYVHGDLAVKAAFDRSDESQWHLGDFVASVEDIYGVDLANCFSNMDFVPVANAIGSRIASQLQKMAKNTIASRAETSHIEAMAKLEQLARCFDVLCAINNVANMHIAKAIRVFGDMYCVNVRNAERLGSTDMTQSTMLCRGREEAFLLAISVLSDIKDGVDVEVPQLTPQQLYIMHSTLRHTELGARNHYMVNRGSPNIAVIRSLCTMGMMRETSSSANFISFEVTPDGAASMGISAHDYDKAVRR